MKLISWSVLVTTLVGLLLWRGIEDVRAHASTEDLATVNQASIERDKAARKRSRVAEGDLRRRLEAHLVGAAKEAKEQATFRGEVKGFMRALAKQTP